MTAATRVQKHRDNLRDQHCQRLEISLATGLIEAARLVAKHQKQPFWMIVEKALTAHVRHHPAILNTPYASRFKPST